MLCFSRIYANSLAEDYIIHAALHVMFCMHLYKQSSRRLYCTRSLMCYVFHAFMQTV